MTAHGLDDVPATRLIGRIGHGASSTIYEVERNGERLAMKVTVADPGTELESRFKAECNALARVSHSNVVRLLGSAVYRGRVLVLFMPLLSGRTLRERIDRDGPMAPGTMLRRFIDFTNGLDALHREGIVHRDVKPSNLFLGRERTELSAPPRGIVTDLGLARATSSLVTTGPFVSGTILSPEQILSGPVDARTDVFALGVSLAEAILGHDPFGLSARPFAALDTDPRPALEKIESYRGAIAEVVARAIEPNPGNRFQSAREMGDALRRLLVTPSSEAA
jgi:serine/threonine-protein kinase